MSSLTDIIFLLLIFFMLTSSLVAPNALNLKLPGSSKTSRVATDQIDNVTISRTGEYFFNGRRISINDLETTLGRKARASSKKMNMTISPAPERLPSMSWRSWISPCVIVLMVSWLQRKGRV
jgi:biopolymer transport protein ExbD